jgi:hypothetical protein
MCLLWGGPDDQSLIMHAGKSCKAEHFAQVRAWPGGKGAGKEAKLG